MKEILKKAIIGLIDKKTIVGFLIAAAMAVAASLAGLTEAEVKEVVCEQPADN